MSWKRPDLRLPNQLRPISFERSFSKFTAASILAKSGDTQVLCAVTIQSGVPKFLQDRGQGWLTAEYRMLPGATPQRQERELMKLSGRTQEIQRLIGRSLRAALDLKLLGERTIIVDADVLQADAGTRTTAITGSFVALAMALNALLEKGEIHQSPIIHQIAAVSVGILQNEVFLDLNYPEDVAAEVDFNLVMNEELNIIEMQGTAELGSFSRRQMNEILDVGEQGIKQLLELQREAISRIYSNRQDG